jgi:hypothetical protein
MVFAGVVCVSATPTTLAVCVTAVWILLHAWQQMDRSAMAGASVSVTAVSVQTRSFKGKLVRRVSLALVSVLNISKFLLIA